MIGNDIVDLLDSETTTLHPRFDARVFDSTERRRLARSADPHRLRWTLWSAKEAAYKAACRLRPTVFSPLRFVVDLDRGEVRHGEEHFALDVGGGDDWVHARATAPVPLCSSQPSARTVSGCRSLGDADASPSEAVRALAIDALAGPLGVPVGALEIESEGRLPKLTAGGQELDAVLTLSHHGRYVAFACRLAEPAR